LLVVRTPRNRLLWLDDRLRAVRVVDTSEGASVSELRRARPLDDTHLAVVQRLRGTPDRWRIAIRDLAAGTERDLVTAEGLPSVEYDRGTRVLVAYGERRVLRYRLSAGAPVQLRGIADLRAIQRVYLTDPTLAGGVVAVATVDGTAAHAFTAPDEASGAALKQRSSTRIRGWIFHVDRAGRIYALESSALAIYGDGKPIVQIPVSGMRRLAVTEDATRFALIQGNEVITFEAGGTERWRMPMPNAVDLAWSADGRLVVSTPGGLMAFDAGTRSRVALACAWSFGVHDLANAGQAFTMPSACAAE
jgi:hypothetical protein